MAGPFSIIAHIGHLYKVQLLKTIKMHSVFVPEKLCKAAIDPLPGQINISSPLIIVKEIKE